MMVQLTSIVFSKSKTLVILARWQQLKRVILACWQQLKRTVICIRMCSTIVIEYNLNIHKTCSKCM